MDRIDVYNNTLRIIDYKSGLINKSNLFFKDWSSIIKDDKKNALFQVLLYSYVNRDKMIKIMKFSKAVIPIQNYDNEFIPVSLSENNIKRSVLNLNDRIFKDFEKEFFQLFMKFLIKKIIFKIR